VQHKTVAFGRPFFFARVHVGGSRSDAMQVPTTVVQVIALHLPGKRAMSSPCDETRQVQRVRCMAETERALMHRTTEGHVSTGRRRKKFCAK
jgi:hypothetical protein